MIHLPQSYEINQHMEARTGVIKHFNNEMEKILNENSHVDKYWILGKAKVHRNGDKKEVKPFLQACLEKPGLVKQAFLYEVDNRRGVKTLLWVMHPDDTLSFPTLGKSIRGSAKNSGIKIVQPTCG